MNEEDTDGSTESGANETDTESEDNETDTGPFRSLYTPMGNPVVMCILAVVLTILACGGVLEVALQDPGYIMRGFVTFILMYFFLQVRDEECPISRPHPAYWRFWLSVSAEYELFLIFILFQTVQDGRLLIKDINPKLEVPLPERDHGGNCLIYDPGNTTEPFHNIWNKMDGFVFAHFLGWYIKTLIIRDWWMCMVISVMFEFLEYSLHHQLPNVSECWWDHWIIDVLVCNGLGIYCGMKTLGWLSMKPYQWQGLWNIPTYNGDIKHIAFQLTPYSLVKLEWRQAANLCRWLALLVMICMFLLAELNTFYLNLLWVPLLRYLVLLRLFFFVNVWIVAMREFFDFMADLSLNKNMGQQAWLVAGITVTEFLIVVKYDPNIIMLPIPFIKHCWILGIVLIFSWTLWRFFICGITLSYEKTRREQQESSAERDRPHGNTHSSCSTASGCRKLRGNPESI